MDPKWDITVDILSTWLMRLAKLSAGIMLTSKLDNLFFKVLMAGNDFELLSTDHTLDQDPSALPRINHHSALRGLINVLVDLC